MKGPSRVVTAKMAAVVRKGDTLKVGVVLVGEGSVDGLRQVSLNLGLLLVGEVDNSGDKSGCGDKVKGLVADKLACEPEEGLLEVVLPVSPDPTFTDPKTLTFDLAEISKYWRFSDLVSIGDFDFCHCGTLVQIRTLAVEGDIGSLHLALLLGQHGGEKMEPTLTSTLLPQRTMGMFSQTRSRSRCQLGTFL